jgi:hypothetical protein
MTSSHFPKRFVFLKAKQNIKQLFQRKLVWFGQQNNSTQLNNTETFCFRNGVI